MIRGRIKTDPTLSVEKTENVPRGRCKFTKAVATGRAANGLGEVKEVDTGAVGGDGRGTTPKYGETSKKASEDETALESSKETEKTQPRKRW